MALALVLCLQAHTAALSQLLCAPPYCLRWRTAARFPRPVQRAISPVLRLSEWRLFGVEVPVNEDAGQHCLMVTEPLREAVAGRLGIPLEQLPTERVTLVRKSLDARKARTTRHGGGDRGTVRPPVERQVKWDHVVDVQVEPRVAKRLKAQAGRQMPAAGERDGLTSQTGGHTSADTLRRLAPRVVVVGAGPCGLFAALSLAQAGLSPIVCERGKKVEDRGRDVGALMARGKLDSDSNFCYGEGGAGTWSDGKLTTRIGRNSADVREVLTTLVRFGAPERILLDGKPHLGTDNLVRLLKGFREELVRLGATFRWQERVEALLKRNGRVSGVRLASGEEIAADAVVLATGHSCRELYHQLHGLGVKLQPKDFAVGFRIEHPQPLINEAQYGEHASRVGKRGQGELPAASYRFATTVASAGAESLRKGSAGESRGCYSFCMCPGGQIVPTSLKEGELCINGMSFSQRASAWANAALVVSVGETFGDFEVAGNPLAGLDFQQAMEQRAAHMGGGGLVCPVQRAPDFMSGKLSSEPLPRSSYRRGIRSAPLHELYPEPITKALQQALRRFGEAMPGFVSSEALLHGVETRTSAPVQVKRNTESCECDGLPGLFPAGEGAGYAGGIVSAAVDGMRVARALVRAHEEAGAAQLADDEEVECVQV